MRADRGEGGRIFRPPPIDDALFYPLFILGVSMLVVPFAAGALFDVVTALFGLPLSEVDFVTLRTGFALVAQGGAMIGLTLARVGRPGLGMPWTAIGLPRRDDGDVWRQEIVVGLFAGLGLIALNVSGSWLTRQVFSLFMDAEELAEHVTRETSSVADALGGGASGWIVLLLPAIAVVVAPISEELFFRGYLYGVLRARFRREPAYAAFWSSAVFALVHFYFIHMLPVFLIGLALVALYRRRGNLVAPIVAHATSNFIVTVATLFSQTPT